MKDEAELRARQIAAAHEQSKSDAGKRSPGAALLLRSPDEHP